MYDLIVKNGKLVTADRVYTSDILVKKDKFAGFVENSDGMQAKEIIDAKGNYVFPGIIDCHAHLNEPGYEYREDFATGSRAAAVGGTTTLIDMPLNNEPPLISSKIFDVKKGMIDRHAVVDYALWGALIDNNIDELVPMHEKGVVAFKAFTCPLTGSFTNINMGHVKKAFEILKPYGAFCGFHCEEYGLVLEMEREAREKNHTGKEAIRDFLDAHCVLTEYSAVRNIIDEVLFSGAKAHICHVSHPKVAQLVKDAQAEGLPITAETCPHYLGFTEDLVFKVGAPAKCTPPLRTADAVESLWDYVLDGTLSCVGSDHSPAADEEKDNDKHDIWTAWGGCNSIQFFLPMMWDLVVNKRKLSPTLITQVMDKNPAKVFGLYGTKGDFEIGFDADIVILDPNREWKASCETNLTKNKVTAFEGYEAKGCPVCTIVRGTTVADNGMYKDEAFGYGHFVRPQSK
jgi:allantoinase